MTSTPSLCPSPSLDDLRARVRAIERPGSEARATVSLGAAEIDAALPWGGLPRGRLHQLTGGGDGFSGPLVAFAARLAARLSRGEDGRDHGPVLWVVERGSADDALYGPGLAAWGLTPDRLLIARADDEDAVLWCLEEGLRCPALAAVVGQARSIDLTAGRRLQLAAEQGNTTGLLLPTGHGAGWRPRAAPAATAAATRWRVETAPAAPAAWGARGLGRARWRVTLERCQGGLPRAWTVESDDASGDLIVVSELRDGQADAPGGPFRRQA